jgi:CPA2 family monovalent cation:H+ antiporter-2
MEAIPIRKASLALLLVASGALLDPYQVIRNPLLPGTIVLLVVLGRGALWATFGRTIHGTLGSSLLLGVGLSHLGEFSCVLIQVGHGEGIFGSDVYNSALFAFVALPILGGMILVPPNKSVRTISLKITHGNC